MRYGWMWVCLMFWAGGAAAADGLSVQGNRIYYGSREVWLQGVAVGDPLLGRAGRPLDDYHTIAEGWNANAVRISVHPGTWREYGRREVTEVLHRNVQAALQSGLFVILAWHAIGLPDGYRQAAPPDLPEDAYDTRLSLAEDFWWRMAQEFGQDGRIVFELWNEPTFAATPSAGRWADVKPAWERLISTIRDAGARNLLLAAGPAWGYDLKGVKEDLLADANTAYAWHVYAGTDGDDPHAWEAHLDGLDYMRPVVVTEWGFEPEGKGPYRGTAESFGNRFAEWFLLPKPLHYTAWCWHPHWSPRLLEEDWSSPTVYGVLVKSLLRRNVKPLVRP